MWHIVAPRIGATFVPQVDTDFLWAEAHERSYTVKANHPVQQYVRAAL